MTPFTTLRGIAAPIAIANIDTDQIIPSQFLKTIRRDGLGEGLFFALRQDPGFILNRTPWSAASMLISLENFGCGSSREHAPWALKDFGVRCVIAPSIADIFYGNCLRNGILPIRLPREIIDALLDLSSNPATAEFYVDLPAQTIAVSGHEPIAFEIEAAAKDALLDGEDDIARTERRSNDIALFEDERTVIEHWRASIPALRF